MEKWEVRVEIVSFCGGLDIRINTALLLLRSWRFSGVKEVLTDWLLVDRSTGEGSGRWSLICWYFMRKMRSARPSPVVPTAEGGSQGRCAS